MLKGLKRKIVLINMALVGVVLITAFTILCVNDYNAAKSELLLSLERSANAATLMPEGPGGPPDGGEPMESEGEKQELGDRRGVFREEREGPKFSVNTVAVLLDAEGAIVKVNEDGASIDEDTLAECAAVLMEAKGDTSDVLHGLGVAYSVKLLPDGGRIAVLSDTEMVTSTLRRSVVSSLLICAGSMVILLLISVWLARLAVKPTEKAWIQQRQFLSDASHELKTPLTVILANNDILLSHPETISDDQRRWLESTGEEAAHMKGLIDRMLTLARSDEEKLAPVLAEFDLAEAAQEAALSFEPVAFDKGVTLTCEAETATVTSDRAMVAQVLQILLDNAVKYTDAGGEIRLTVSAKGDGEISVTNTGEPMSEETMAHLFDRFYRADKARGQSGYGLGLAIAKSVADTLKIKLSVTSDATNGTVFTMKF